MRTARRQFIRSGLACALGMSAGRMMIFGAEKPKLIPVGFQLFTVRGEFARDVPGTLGKLGEIGYNPPFVQIS